TQQPTDSSLIRQLQEKHELDSVNTATVNRLHIHYRFASSQVRKVDDPVLQELVKQLNNNPSLNVLVASFTDCFGSKESNLKLARKRSESVRNYLRRKGIAEERINLDFFGKQHFIKSCKEDSTYNQQSQLANRRSDLILTEEKHPSWQPSGEELDLAGAPFVSAYRIRRDSAGKQLPVNKEMGNAEPAKIAVNAKSARPEKNTADRIQPASSAAGKNMGNGHPSPTGKKNKTDLQNSVIRQKEADRSSRVSQQTVRLSKIEKMRLDTMQGRMRIAALLDMTPRLKQPSIIDQMTSRTPKKSIDVYSVSDSVKVELYDNGVFDYDSVSVIYNKKLVIYQQQLLTNKPISFYVKLDSDPAKNEMIFFAENLGLTPPNSALMIITDGENKRTEINVSSDLSHNAVIYFIKVKR
ncbi:MAG: OmpA family protein, partial [Bacteroidota bacterium]|nr:OmpA family protein [Bacteroidota bacterium]